MKESEFQAKLISDIKKRIPRAIVLKTDPNYIQGIPDLIVLGVDKWAAIECKRSEKATKRPNQEYYISIMNDMSYATFANPKNKEEVLDELQQAFES